MGCRHSQSPSLCTCHIWGGCHHTRRALIHAYLMAYRASRILPLTFAFGRHRKPEPLGDVWPTGFEVWTDEAKGPWLYEFRGRCMFSRTHGRQGNRGLSRRQNRNVRERADRQFPEVINRTSLIATRHTTLKKMHKLFHLAYTHTHIQTDRPLEDRADLPRPGFSSSYVDFLLGIKAVTPHLGGRVAPLAWSITKWNPFHFRCHRSVSRLLQWPISKMPQLVVEKASLLNLAGALNVHHLKNI